MIPPWKISGRLGNQMFQIAYLYAQMKDGNISDIFVQNPKYFDKYEEEIKAIFSDGIGFLPHVSIHIRRGDYMSNPFYVDLTKTDYYEKAIALFPESTFLVFSDDTVFAKEMFPDTKKFQVVEGGDELEDFNMASSCEHHIIANSSFSWWYAFLSPAPNKKIIAPSVTNWYTDGIERTVCPQNWTRI